MDDWVIWLVAAVILAAGEIATTSFFLAPFAIGALLAAIAALARGSGRGLVGAVRARDGRDASRSSGRSRAGISSRARPHRTGTAALIGRNAIVLDRVSHDGTAGTVKLEGETWTARAYDEDRTFEPGTRVQVIEIRGATALVDDL